MNDVVLWNRTIDAAVRLKHKVDAHGRYQGRHVIKRDGPIDNGVSIGGSFREAIVVDYKRSNYLPYMFREIHARCKNGDTFRRDRVLKAVYDVVDEMFVNRNNDEVEAFVTSFGAGNDVKMDLDLFLQAKLGVCRHINLTCAALLERFVYGGFINGRVSLDRNQIPGIGAHEWTRYTSFERSIFIIDVMQQYVGSLNDSLGKPDAWQYSRPEDLGIFPFQ